MTVKLDAKFEIKANHLFFSYELNNPLTQDIYLFNRLVRFDKTGAGTVDKDLVYVSFEKGPTVHLSKRLQEIPPYLQVYAPEIPYAKSLPSSQNYTESLKIPLPLQEYGPYLKMTRARSENKSQEAVITQDSIAIYFTLGYILQKEGIQAMNFKADDEELFYFQGAVDLYKEQNILRTPIQKVAVPIQWNK